MATPPVFVSGAVLLADQMNDIGLWLVKSQTIGTAVSSVTVTDAFSADFDSYKIVISGGVASASIDLRMTLGASATGYSFGLLGRTYAGSTITFEGSNTTSWFIGTGQTGFIGLNVDITNPFLAEQTYFGTAVAASASGLFTAGRHTVATSFTDFTITTSTGTLTGGTIRVYGYRN